MDHAWLDSLSEDWVSQPGCDTSADKLPFLKDADQPETARSRERRSRIPRRTPNGKLPLSSTRDTSPIILSERSANDINVSSLRLPSKLSQEIKASRAEGRTRSVSTATGGSVVHNSIQRHTSSSRRESETPEWKRRLVHGKIQYGEQRDLFCSAAAGLQDMFKPPPPNDDIIEHAETTLSSSPPQSAHQAIDADLERYIDADDDEEPDGNADVTPSPSPRRPQRGVKYKLNVDNISMSPNIGDSRVRVGSTPERDRDDIYRDESCLTAPHEAAEMSRKTSGQSDTRNEDFSPIMIGKHCDGDGGVDFAPIEVPVEQLWQKLERLRIDQMLLDSQADLQAGFSAGESSPANVETTEDYLGNGAFVNVQRGGRSGDGSFYHRRLSSDIGVDTSDMLPEESLQASTPKQFPSIRTQATNPLPTFHISHSPSLPRAPFPSPEKRQARESAGGHTASSPLKLFGPYDTFTNQTLLRRISQFEEASGSPNRQSLNPSSPGEFHRLHQESEKRAAFHSTRAFSQFGGGDLDGYAFTGDLSLGSGEDLEAHDKENVAPNPALSNLPSLHPPRESSPDDEPALLIRRRRNKSLTPGTRLARASSMSGEKHQPISLPNGAPASAGTPKRDAESEGKRPRTSPSKDPTPKRRRTLHRSDVAFGREDQLAAVGSAHQQMQSAMGKKRKDARPGEFELADPSVLAMRSILWPRNSTSSPRLSQHEKPMHSIIQALQHESAVLHGDEPSETERKPSIRTQDFVDQAAQIMAMIRSQVRPGLASLEESEAENKGASPGASLTDSYQESTNEPLSRPPSREGKLWSKIPQRQEDPELISRLQKYQELSDTADVISSSLRSMGLANEAPLTTQELEGCVDDSRHADGDGPMHIDDNIISDLPNVRITSTRVPNNELLSPGKDFRTTSSGRSTSRDFPTTSSRGSESRKTIMPQSVSHLIPDRVGSMYLDKQNNIWIKKKEPEAASPSDTPPSEDTEDDPFASIPDLSVDVTRELQHLRLATALREAAADAELRSSPRSPLDTKSRQSSRGYYTLSPRERPDPHMAALASEQLEKLEDRATTGSATSQEDVYRDTSAQDSKGSDPRSTTKRRNLTISFSSPIASIIHDVLAEDLNCLEDDPENEESEPYIGVFKSAMRHGPQGPGRGVVYGPSRPPSARGPDFVPRPVSRIDEQDEESTVEIHPDDNRQVSILGENSMVSHRTPDARHASLSFIINHTAGHGPLSFQPDESAIIGRNVGKLSLSPLSEFTLNNSDQSFGFEVSYLIGHRHMATGDGSKRVMSVAIRELVDKLSEVEPYEPFWEDITELNLQDKQLTSLHMLDEFCNKVVTLDASKNKLGHLDGVPSTVRQLKASQNMLTELTSWDHLMNLQYVDVSGNEVKSLSALKNLVHLRSIRADDNQLTGLDGLDCHDGLLSLRARNNLIEEVDFSTVSFERLTELDLDGNSICSIQNLELLPALSRLRLQRNRLCQFTLEGRMKTLRQLDVSDNDLTTLDLSNMPNIHSVHADRNRIHEVSGFERARRLDSLSLREQHGDLPLNLSFLSSAYEIRKLFLSGNYLGRFEPMVDFLNLQLLDLANCGLQSLPEKMGQLMPNLRTLNVNFNAIADLSPLRFIPRLKKLLAAGNRLADSTAATQLVTEFPHLTQLDVRDNPVTLGFYAPVQVLVPTDRSGYTDAFMLPDADVERDVLFASRLDEATRLRRRLHQLVLVASCRRLRKLDGLPVRRRDVLAKDDLLEVLVAEGLVPELEETLVAQPDQSRNKEETPAEDAEVAAQLKAGSEAARHNETMRSGRWSPEDRFA
ncbi:Septation initiation network scaffold protein cdc11 [Tolypocladium paradoxum]|uniref:Septation initiation network scaffold protein cdc11 n=1 Tax=Tolypocladium paradoxum TaxID=94208 RepID=A0A2S4KQP7_9HYPO|nr:Septation initiation network scaffold protein cdc11 [Tolypocladium paradoxum]